MNLNELGNASNKIERCIESSRTLDHLKGCFQMIMTLDIYAHPGTESSVRGKQCYLIGYMKCKYGDLKSNG